MAYISPNDFVDGNWADEALAYDGEVGAGHYASTAGAGWSDDLELILPSTIVNNKIKVYAQVGSEAGKQIRVKIRFQLYGNWYWTTVYTGDFNNNDWTEIDLPLYQISRVRIALSQTFATSQRIHEVYMWEVEPVAPGYDNCVGLWRMNENAANKEVEDYSGEGNDGEAAQNTDQLSTTGKINGALTSAGDNTDKIDCGNDPSLRLTGAFSFVAWINADTWANWDAVLGKSNLAWDDGWMLYYGWSELRFFVGSYLNDYATFSFDKTAEWHLVIGTFDGTNIKLYVDISEAGTDDTGSLVDSASSLILGYHSPGYDFDGKLDVIALFNKALSPEEMVFLWNSGNGREHLSSARPLVGGSLASVKKGLAR